MVAHFNIAHDTYTWFADNGDNNHITCNLEQLTLSQPHIGHEHVAVDNGQGLNITHIGNVKFHTLTNKSHLDHVLRYLYAYINLISNINLALITTTSLF